MKHAFVDYYQCPTQYAKFAVNGELHKQAGYFRLNSEGMYFGQHSQQHKVIKTMDDGSEDLPSLSTECQVNSQGECLLPFDADQVVDNLRLERYMGAHTDNILKRWIKFLIRQTYYALRPLMSVNVRKHLQRRALSDWDKIPFPRWPVDRSVDLLMEDMMQLSLQSQPNMKIPFIWFWPDNHQGAIIISHDVETDKGRDFCSRLMDITEAHSFRSSFQFIPEKRYTVDEELFEEIRRRGFEINLHGLNHDGHLFDNYQEFWKRAQKINQYAKQYKAVGFRSPVMYRNPDWFKEFELEYDMSMPNVAHLDPQRGGCCTVMPYFIDHIVELPLTTTQDYPLFNILQQFNLDLWKTQCDEIIEKNGLISILVHPDYVIESRARAVYETLLAYLSSLANQHNLWRALPKEAARWWRQRSRMRLVQDQSGEWVIQGDGAERACIAYARLEQGQLVYDLADN